MRFRSTLVIAAMVTLGLGAAPGGGAAEPALAVAPARVRAALTSPSATADPVVHAATPAGGRSAGGLGWYSSNWAGYAVAAGPYRSVSGQWTVPAVVPTGRSSYSAQWVGVDGVSSAALIQAGTEVSFFNGTAHYAAWWEILPAPAVSPSMHDLTRTQAATRRQIKEFFDTGMIVNESRPTMDGPASSCAST